MPRHSIARHYSCSQNSFFSDSVSFDHLCLSVQPCPSELTLGQEQVAFHMLQLKRLLESAFQLEGFNQATANHSTADSVVVEYAPAEGMYRTI